MEYKQETGYMDFALRHTDRILHQVLAKCSEAAKRCFEALQSTQLSQASIHQIQSLDIPSLQKEFGLEAEIEKLGDSERLKITYYISNQKIGFASFVVLPNEIHAQAFYPMDNCRALEGVRTGIGTLAHIETVHYLARTLKLGSKPLLYGKCPLGTLISNARLQHLARLLQLEDENFHTLSTLHLSLDEHLERSIQYGVQKHNFKPKNWEKTTR